MKTYELQTFLKGRWVIQSTFPDRDDAMREAKKRMQNRRYPGVRVTEEVYDEDTNRSRTRSIFSFEQGIALDKSAVEERYFSQMRESRVARRSKKQAALTHLGKACGATWLDELFPPVLYLFSILIVGAFSLIGLHTLFRV